MGARQAFEKSLLQSIINQNCYLESIFEIIDDIRIGRHSVKL